MSEAVHRPGAGFRARPAATLSRRCSPVRSAEDAALGKLVGSRRAQYPSRIKCALLGWRALMQASTTKPAHAWRPLTTTRAGARQVRADGRVAELPAGTQLQITQALGGSFTLWVHGQLMRLRGADADAIGKCASNTAAAAGGGIEAVREQVWQVLRSLLRPRSRSTSSSSALVYGCEARADGRGGFRVR